MDILKILEQHRLWVESERTSGKQANLQGADLQGQDLSQALLLGANLEQANLQGANLQGTVLQQANLSGACLQGANLERANLWGAYLMQADLQEGCLRRAKAKFADFREANLLQTDLRQANLWGVNFSDAVVASPEEAPMLFLGTNLQMATWTDGRRCLRGSVGRCVWE